MSRRRSRCFIALLGVLCTQTEAQNGPRDWPQWRGPNRDAVAGVVLSAPSWPEKLKLKWKVNVGEGHSSPVTANGKIYLHTRLGDREVVWCLKPDDGEVSWQQDYAAPYTVNPAAAGHGMGVRSTPVVADGRICTFGISGALSCFNAQSGKPLWRKEFGAPAFGTAMSPMVDNGLLIAHVGTAGGGALTAFDPQFGTEKWSWKGDGPAYASPIVATLAGTRQIITQTQQHIVGLEAATGVLLWSIPFDTPYEQNIVTPVLYQETLIFSGLGNGVMAVKVLKRGLAWSTETLWHTKDVSMYLNSPVLSGDLLFGLSHLKRGQFFCLDPRTGATLWTSSGRQGENAAMVDGGSVLLLLTDNAELIVASKSRKEFEVLRRYTVADSPTWAHPVPSVNGILIKDAKTLALWSTN